MNKYIALDCEAGGIPARSSLLQLYLCVLDEYFNFVDGLLLNLKPNDGMYHLTAEGMNVNKINFVLHDKEAMTYKQGGTELYNFLKKNTNRKAITYCLSDMALPETYRGFRNSSSLKKAGRSMSHIALEIQLLLVAS
jgi:hypothetical protein